MEFDFDGVKETVKAIVSRLDSPLSNYSIVCSESEKTDYRPSGVTTDYESRPDKILAANDRARHVGFTNNTNLNKIILSSATTVSGFLKRITFQRLFLWRLMVWIFLPAVLLPLTRIFWLPLEKL